MGLCDLFLARSKKAAIIILNIDTTASVSAPEQEARRSQGRNARYKYYGELLVRTVVVLHSLVTHLPTPLYIRLHQQRCFYIRTTHKSPPMRDGGATAAGGCAYVRMNNTIQWYSHKTSSLCYATYAHTSRTVRAESTMGVCPFFH